MRERIPGLDGLRAISILLVIFAHSVGRLPAGLSHILPFRLGDYYGQLGVSVFFVISGFLITSLLLRESELTGTIRLSHFYYRRALRIFPAYYTYLLTMAAIAYSGTEHISFRDIGTSAIFISDYTRHAGASVGRTWSLSVEEQFYLVWPVVVMSLNRQKVLFLSIGLILASPFVRIFTYLVVPDARDLIPIMFHTRADTLLCGCVLALLHRSGRLSLLSNLLLKMQADMLAIVFVLVISPLMWLYFRGGYLISAGYTLQALAILVILLSVIASRHGYLVRLLETKLLIGVGILSYSLYLWHFAFSVPVDPGLLGGESITVPLSALVAWLSFRFLEVPFFALRRRATVSASSGVA